MNEDKELLITVKKTKLQHIGHVMGGERYEILRLIKEGNIDGK